MDGPILIIGNGALGTGLAYVLDRFQIPVRFLNRSGSVATEASIFLDGESPSALRVPALNPSELANISIVFVTVKAYDLEPAFRQHLPLLRAGTVVIPVGNGAVDGIVTAAAADFPRLIFRLGTSTLAVSREERQSFTIRGREYRIVWGAHSPVEAIISNREKELIELPLSPFIWSPTAFENYRRKWLFNSTLNSIVAVGKIKTNGGVLQKPKMLMMVFSEAYTLGEEHWGPWDSSPEFLFSELLKLVEKTSRNENSMMADLRRGKKTETEFLAGMAKRYDGYPLLKEIDGRLNVK